MRFISSFLILSVFVCTSFISCSESKSNQSLAEPSQFNLLFESEQFVISEKDHLFLLEVKHVSKQANQSERYLLYPRNAGYDSLNNITHYVPYPLSSIAISSTTHLGYLEALGMVNQISGATGLSLYYSPVFQDRIKRGEVASIGTANFMEEVLIQLAPDVLFAFALTSANLAVIKDLRESGTKVILINEYLETNPIEKAAWLRFFACFYGKDKLMKADAYLNSIEDQYRNIQSLMLKASSQPKVMMGFPWKGSWFISGGNSYQALFYKDAGADYIWKDHLEEGSIPLDIEVVLRDGLNAEVWINPGNKESIEELLESDDRFQNFPSLQMGKVYSNYLRSNENGANDYWEKGVVRPDLVLKDLATIFHPELIEDHEFYFYKQLSL